MAKGVESLEAPGLPLPAPKLVGSAENEALIHKDSAGHSAVPPANTQGSVRLIHGMAARTDLPADLEHCTFPPSLLGLQCEQARRGQRAADFAGKLTANPKVNEELKQRLPSPIKQHSAESASQLRELEASSNTLVRRSVSETLAEDLPKGGLFVPETKVSPAFPLWGAQRSDISPQS
ncbi:hypothetical protein SKAU_G00211170 [Synaphobranchus kaupii]|uniref:Uncharacterized protein n=1 Tax=Synaphobranchus kaupii TaxID=118154 RepID=A0A9Q1ISX4_SYNKA|nr:hypothetical protein SKAU_G00211170 [Synaphobranchus kaupii]